MSKEKKWYYVEYDTFGLPSEIQARDEIEAETIAIQNFIDLGVDLTIENMETVLNVPFQSTDDFMIILNTTYLTNTLQVYKDEKIDVVMYLISSLRPVVIKGGNIHTMISPIRKG